MHKGLRLSAITIGWGVYLVVSAAFMLQVNLWLAAMVGYPFLKVCFWAVSLLLLITIIIYALRARLGMLRIGAIFAVFALAYLIGMLQYYFEEKTHILMYGLLGYLAAKDLLSRGRAAKPKDLVMALAFVALVSACDETFQWFLPYRVGEIKDFILNMAGGSLGIALFLVLKGKTRDSDHIQEDL